MSSEINSLESQIANAEKAFTESEREFRALIEKGNPYMGSDLAPVEPEALKAYIGAHPDLFEDDQLLQSRTIKVRAGQHLAKALFELMRLNKTRREEAVATLRGRRNAALRKLEDESVKPILAALNAEIVDEATAKAAKDAIVALQTEPTLAGLAAKRERNLPELIAKAKAAFVEYISFA